MLADKVHEQSTSSTLEGVVWEGFAEPEILGLGVQAQTVLFSPLSAQERLCLNSDSALSWVTLDKIRNHSATVSYFLHMDANVTASILRGEALMSCKCKSLRIMVNKILGWSIF